MPDALVSALAGAGLQPVFLPRTGFTPPDLYTYLPGSLRGLKPRAKLVRHGPLSDYLRSGAPPLEIVPKPSAHASLKGVHTSSKNAGASLDFLSKALACLGVPALPKGQAGIELGNSLMFKFEDVTGLGVDLSNIEKRLPDLTFRGIPKEQAEAGHIHIVYEYVYARKLVMERTDKSKFDAGVEGKIGEWFQLGEAKVNVTTKDDLIISFVTKKKHEPPAFAYRAAQVIRDGDLFAINAHVTMAGESADAKLKYVPHPEGALAVSEAI